MMNPTFTGVLVALLVVLIVFAAWFAPGSRMLASLLAFAGAWLILAFLWARRPKHLVV